MRRHLYYYTLLEHPYEEALSVLGAEPSRWLPEPAEPDGPDWSVDLHADGTLPVPLATRPVRVTLGEPVAYDNRLLRAITWRSVTAHRLFPVLTADLELVPLSDWASQLSLMGSYRPPLTVVGDAGDRLLGHRVAEACVRRFVLDVAARLAVATLPG